MADRIQQALELYRSGAGSLGYVAEKLGVSKRRLIIAARQQGIEPSFSEATVEEELCCDQQDAASRGPGTMIYAEGINLEDVPSAVLRAYPDTQAIYLYGSYATGQAWPTSDVDIALLLPPKTAKAVGSLAMSDLRFELEDLLEKPVDLVNARLVSTVLQKEVIAAERRIYTGDAYAAEEFEMLVLSFYQRLNRDRREILEALRETGRAYDV